MHCCTVSAERCCCSPKIRNPQGFKHLQAHAFLPFVTKKDFAEALGVLYRPVGTKGLNHIFEGLVLLETLAFNRDVNHWMAPICQIKNKGCQKTIMISDFSNLNNSFVFRGLNSHVVT